MAFSVQMKPAKSVRYLVCRVGDRVYAFAVNHVREVVDNPGAVGIPGAVEQVAGLINIRGKLLTLVNGSKVLGQGGSSGEKVVVVETAGTQYGVLVDEVVELAQLSMEDEQIAIPEGMPPSLIAGLARFGTEVAGIVDLPALIEPVRSER